MTTEYSDFKFPYMLLFVAVLIYFAGFATGWVGRKPVARAIAHRSIQTEEPEDTIISKSKVKQTPLRRREPPVENCTVVFVTQTGECFHCYRDRFGLRSAVKIRELRTCRLCISSFR